MSGPCPAPAQQDQAEEAARDPHCVSARCSWPCAPPGGLARALCLRRGAADGEPGGEPVVAERTEGGQEPCELRLECRPGAQMVSVGVLSQARNMEVYVGEEYCGTGRGQSRGQRPAPGETEEVTLYHKYLKFECPATSCKIKLLSFGSSIDLDRVQTIMESMGSKLSPGAQQLMDMVRCQQKNSLPLGDKLNWILGKNSEFGGGHAVDGLHSAAVQSSLSQPASEPLPVKNHVTSETVYKDLKISRDLNTEIPERGNTFDSERLTTQQNAVDLRNDLKVMGSLHVQEQASETPSVANPQVLLPFLQNLCSQVSHLRLKDGERQLRKSSVAKEEGIQCVGVEQQPICSYLEKIISKNMDLMEKKLMDYIDCQIQALQTHIDNKMLLLMDLVQNSKPNKISQAHYDSNEGFSNGER
ncbi:ATPase PAAT isoform X2 [Pithys albifrons albifrons]|uniref:ATPase PAAT isoform X2 n=1 Tax=Pithys albifrons albifrons TaxID=3385563 RepID=UPI003A5CFFF6